MNFLTDIFVQTKSFELVSQIDKEGTSKTILNFYEEHKPTNSLGEFGKRTFDKSHFNLPLQFGVLSFSTKYRLTGNLKTEETGTKVTFKLKNDPYWTAINCVTPIIILVLLISNRSTPSIVVSGFIITAFLIRWVSTSNNFERIESELKNILNR